MENPKITYFFDALCGWCYGFKNVVHQLHTDFKDRVDFDVISGGLFFNDRVGPINEIAPYIKQGAYKRVEEGTTVQFGKAFTDKLLGDGDIYMDSTNPAIALCIAKELKPEKAFDFAETLLDAVYRDGISPDNKEAFLPYVMDIGINENDFLDKLSSKAYKKKALAEFRHFQEVGVESFPSLVFEDKGEYILLSRGYLEYDELESRLTELLER